MATSPANDDPLVRQRHDLLEKLRREGHLRSDVVQDAMRTIPREEFVPAPARRQAYWDQPLGIGAGQTISAPHMVAIMSEALELEPGFRVLEIGTGSGYQAAVLSRLVGPQGVVVTVERHAALSRAARKALDRIGATNVKTIVGDGSLGHPDAAPYDRILVTAAAPRFPRPLLEQLRTDGIILAPIGRRMCQLVRARKTRAGLLQESLGACAFVPLKGAHGQGFRFFGT